MARYKENIPSVVTELRHDTVDVPSVITKCSGININGRKLKSFIFTTDIAIICNTDADAVIAVYPFTPYPAIIQAISSVASIPVIAGVGGGTTQGLRSSNISLFAESLGAISVVLNAPTPLETISLINGVVDIPIVITIVSEYTDIQEKLDAGADILNVSGGANTASIVRKIREKYPTVPIIATGGPTDESILETIEAGANAITYTPPSNGELFKRKMNKYRVEEEEKYTQEEE